jgi:hypothetical protein
MLSITIMVSIVSLGIKAWEFLMQDKDETIPFISALEKLEANKAPIESLEQDCMNLIASELSYKYLANLSQTSVRMHEFVENTMAGQIARKANDLITPPSLLAWFLAHPCISASVSCVTLLSLCAGSGFGGAYLVPENPNSAFGGAVFGFTSFVAGAGIFCSGIGFFHKNRLRQAEELRDFLISRTPSNTSTPNV